MADCIGYGSRQLVFPQVSRSNGERRDQMLVAIIALFSRVELTVYTARSIGQSHPGLFPKVGSRASGCEAGMSGLIFSRRRPSYLGGTHRYFRFLSRPIVSGMEPVN